MRKATGTLKQNISRKVLPVVLTASMVLSMLPLHAYAGEVTGQQEYPAGIIEISDIVEEYIPATSDNDSHDNEDLFYQYMLEQGKKETAPVAARRGLLKAAKVTAKARLSDSEKKLYEIIFARAKDIVERKEASAIITLSISELDLHPNGWTAGDLGLEDFSNQEAIKTAANKVIGDMIALGNSVKALLTDHPYYFFWYDKTEGTRIHTNEAKLLNGDEPNTVKISGSVEITLYVSSDYSASKQPGTTNVNSDLISKAVTAVGNASEIINKSKGKSDYEKLLAYKEAICAEVSYDKAAAENDSTPYGDPWQLIHVFDKDPDTNVVCEGYSKAFKYLCDLGSLSDASCYIVSGKMDGSGSENGSGPHMWNVVSLKGGNYLVDVTNSDDGTMGQVDNRLFLVGTTGEKQNYNLKDAITNEKIVKEASYPNYYKFSFGENEWISYKYDYDLETILGVDVLTLSSTKYVDTGEEPATEPVSITKDMFVISDTNNLTYDGTGKKVTVNAIEGEVITNNDYIVSYEIVGGRGSLNESGVPVGAGSYNAVITGQNNYKDSFKVAFEIAKASQVIVFVTNSVEKTFGDDSFTNNLSGAQGSLTYDSSNKNVATISTEGTVTLVSAGNTTITAQAAGNDNYNESEKVSYSLTVKKALQTSPSGLSGVVPQTHDGQGAINNTTAKMEYSENENFAEGTVVPCQDGSTPVAAGKTYYVRFAGDDNHEASEGAPVNVPAFTPADIASQDKLVVVTNLETTYTGEVQQPSFGGNLAKDQDYTVSYTTSDGSLSATGLPVGAGTYTVTVTGKNAYTGSFTETFTINKKTIQIPQSNGKLEYNESEQTGVAEGDDYTLTGSAKATAVGEYTVTASLKDKKNTIWSNNTTEEKTISWSIIRRAAANKPTDLRGVAPSEENGKGKITGTSELMEYADDTGFSKAEVCSDSQTSVDTNKTYYVRYKQTETDEASDYVTVVVPGYTPLEDGKDPLTTQKLEFEKNALTVTFGDEDFIPALSRDNDGGAVSFVSGNEKVVTVDADGKVHIVGAGSAEITATAAETEKYTAATAKISVTVKRKQIEVPQAISGLKADGTEKTGVPEGTGYTLTGHKQTEAGTYTAKATPEANYEWTDGTTAEKSIEWSMAAADPDPVTNISADLVPVSDLKKTYNGSTQTPSFGGGLKAGENYTVAYSVKEGGKGRLGAGYLPLGAGVYTVTISGQGSYTGSFTETFSIEKADPVLSFASNLVSKKTGDGKFLHTLSGVPAGAKVTYESNAPEIAAVDGASGEVSIAAKGTATITATTSATDDYNSVAAKYTIEVTEASSSGGGTSSGGGGSSGGNSSSGNSGNSGSGSNATNNRTPATSGNQGWSDIQNEISGADKGDTISVDMNGATTVPSDVLEEISGKSVTVSFGVGNGISWEVNGEDIPGGTNPGELNLGVETNTNNIPQQAMEQLTGGRSTIQMSLSHNGSFGMTLKLNVSLGASNTGLWANLYYYNPSSGNMEGMFSARIGSGGLASFPFKHASEYAIVIDETAHMTGAGMSDDDEKPIPESAGEEDASNTQTPANTEQVTHDNPFNDVNAGDWFYEDVLFMNRRGLMTGTTGTSFSPDMNMTRAMAAMILYRADGGSATGTSGQFADVPVTAWYTQAVNWAASNGIVNGYGNRIFGPEDYITREQLVTMMHRYAQRKGVSLTTGGLGGFTDTNLISSWAQTPVAWAVENGIIFGVNDTSINPKGYTTRAQVAAVLHRFLQ